MNNQEQLYQLLHNYFFEHLESRRKASPQTIKAYKQSINEFRKYMSAQKNIPMLKLEIASFSRDNVYDFLVYQRDEKHLKAATLNLRLSALKSLIRYCGDEDPAVTSAYLALTKIRKFKDENRSSKIEYLNQEQLELLFTLPDMDTKLGRRNLFIMIFLYQTGARIDEFLNIRLTDIIRQNTVQVRLHGKGDKTRYIPILDDVSNHLDAYIQEFHTCSKKDAFLVYTIHQHKHTQMTEGTINYFLKQYAAQAVETDACFPQDLHCHTMRHSIAMAMYKKGIPLTYIKDFLGHANLNSVSIYAHADDATIVEAIKLANENLEFDVITPTKSWKGHEQELLAYCGLE